MKTSRIQFGILLFGFLLSLCSCNVESWEQDFLDGGWWVLKVGDNPEWADPDFDDSEWDEDGDIYDGKVFWTRIKIDLKEDMHHQSIAVGALSSYEAYWDGQYMYTSGELKTVDKDEVPGKFINYTVMPDSLVRKGKHVLALRCTKQYGDDGHFAYFLLGDTFSILRGPLQLSKYMFLLAGALLLAALYLFFSFLNQSKEYTSLIFSVICLLICALLMVEYVKQFYQYTYDFQRTRLEIVGGINLALSIMIPIYFMIQFSFPWKKYLLIGMAITLFYLEYNYHYNFDYNAIYHAKFIWGISAFIVSVGIYNKVKGAWIVLIGLAAGVATLMILTLIDFPYISPFDFALFFGYILIVISMFYVLTLRRREERLAYEASLVHSERLKNELLKKNIKPHFIMNTLTSLIDWVEESPKDGVKFINELASEFEVLNEIADYKLIPIDQEIKLCKSHMKIMGYRKEVNYIWEEKGIDHNDIIPPAIIHTAVENGVTHSLPDDYGNIKFILSFEKGKDFKKYKLETIAGNRGIGSNGKGGTGLKYIQSRLQESYPDNWELISQATDTGWETIINIKL